MQSSQQVELDLLDDDSQALLSKVMPERSRHNTGPLKSVAKTVLDVDEERVTASTVRTLLTLSPLCSTQCLRPFQRSLKISKLEYVELLQASPKEASALHILHILS